MVYLKSVENVITLGKLIGLLFLFCLPLLSILFLIMGTIFLVVHLALLIPAAYIQKQLALFLLLYTWLLNYGFANSSCLHSKAAGSFSVIVHLAA